MPGSYTYPNDGDDPDRQNVLRNHFGIRSASELREVEYLLTDMRQIELFEGLGPSGAFDAPHLKAIHRHIFQDVYEWAGHTRNERPVVDGEEVEPIGTLAKGGHVFLPGSRIEMGLAAALDPIRDVEALRGSSREDFATRAGGVLGELNFVHPFREGNGRAQEAFIRELGAHVGHDVDFTVTTRRRMIEASIETSRDPHSPAMAQLLLDAVDPARREALRTVMADLRAQVVEPMEHAIRTAHAGERVSGTLLGLDPATASIVAEGRIVLVPRQDLPPEPRVDHEVALVVRTEFVRAFGTQDRPDDLIPAIAVWQENVSKAVARALDAYPEVREPLQDAAFYAARIWKEPDAALAQVRQAIVAEPDKARQVVAELERDPRSLGELLGGRTLLRQPDDERRRALEQVPVFAGLIADFAAQRQLAEPLLRQQETEWRAAMSSPLPALSPEAMHVLQNLARAHGRTEIDQEERHRMALGALSNKAAWNEVKQWGQDAAARLAPPDALSRIPGLSNERGGEIMKLVGVVDIAVREARQTIVRENERTRSQEIEHSRSIGYER